MHISVNPLANGTKLFQKTWTRPQTTSGRSGEKLEPRFVFKRSSIDDSMEFFIIDTGSDQSIVKSNSFEIANYPSEQFLIAANASKISTQGEWI